MLLIDEDEDPVYGISSCHRGTIIFQSNRALTYFTKETILREELKNDDNRELYTLYGIHHSFQKFTNRSSLFYLMSILPDNDAVACKMIMDRDKCSWKISIQDVLIVLLNWGATLKDLGVAMKLEDFYGDSTIRPTCLPYKPQLQSPISSEISKDFVPRPKNIKLMLQTIGERLPADSQMPIEHLVLLVKVLVNAATSDKMRGTNFGPTLNKILESFQPWNDQIVTMLVGGLELSLHTCLYVCSCVFQLHSERSKLVVMFACHNILHSMFGLPAEPSLDCLVNNLFSPGVMIQRFDSEKLFIISQLIFTVLLLHMEKIPPWPKETVQKLHGWSVEMRQALIRCSRDSGHVRERLARITSYCVSFGYKIYNCSFYSVGFH